MLCRTRGRSCSCAALRSSKVRLRAIYCDVQSMAGSTEAVQLLYQNCDQAL